MIVKNFSKFPTEEINRLVEFVSTNFKSLINNDIEIHVRNDNGKTKAIGISFTGYYPDFITAIPKQKFQHSHLIKDIEITTKQFAVVYVTKNPTRYICGRNPDKTWQELFVVTLVHELRHLWHDRKRMGWDEEEDCRMWERRALKKYKKNETSIQTPTGETTL